MAIQELVQSEIIAVSGGDRNLGSEYQYSGDPADRTAGEVFVDIFGPMVDFVLGSIY